MKQFVVAVEPQDKKRLKQVLKVATRTEERWLEDAREQAGLEFLRGRAASMARARIREEYNRMRAQGSLRGTWGLVITPGVQAELKARKMHRAFDPVPAGHTGAAGRRVGAGPRHYGRSSEEDETTLTERLAVELADEVGEQLVRACHWTSAPIVDALWAWQQKWGDGPEVELREAQRQGMTPGWLALFAAASARPATADALLEKAVLQDQIVTTGDIIRAAIQRTI
ncbi:hypothetical protein ABZX40_40560 [Streptomyces sp. NPDC004610]|uniref:hypothetical protein n=1 Tax=unclassified Streptomyces TaxID=2593676 RepID=UPI0033AB9C3F